jgi:hypothetical protein
MPNFLDPTSYSSGLMVAYDTKSGTNKMLGFLGYESKASGEKITIDDVYAAKATSSKQPNN